MEELFEMATGEKRQEHPYQRMVAIRPEEGDDPPHHHEIDDAAMTANTTLRRRESRSQPIASPSSSRYSLVPSFSISIGYYSDACGATGHMFTRVPAILLDFHRPARILSKVLCIFYTLR